MEKKTAIVVINNTHFDSQRILAYNNVERIAWFAQLVDDDASIHDEDLVVVFDTVEEFCNIFNHGWEVSPSESLVAIEYTEKVDGKFHNPHYPIGDLSMRLCVKIKDRCQNLIELQKIANIFKEISKNCLGNTECKISGYWNDNCDYRMHIYLIGDKCMILNNLSDFIFEIHDCYAVSFCEPEWSVDGKDLSAIKFDGDEHEYDDKTPVVSQSEPIKVGNVKVVDTDTLAPQMDTKPEEKKEEVKEKPKYDGEFVDHIADIWREGRRIILVELSGEKYVINGLFDNDDIIIDCYIADTMHRIDRYFIVGAQDAPMDEAEWYADYFMKKVVKDRKIGDCWYLTETQFKFLKEA